MLRTHVRLVMFGLVAVLIGSGCTSAHTPLADAMCRRALPDGSQDVPATPRRGVTNHGIDRFIDDGLGLSACKGRSIPMTGTEQLHSNGPLVKVFAVDLGATATAPDRKAVAVALRKSGLFVRVAVTSAHS